MSGYSSWNSRWHSWGICCFASVSRSKQDAATIRNVSAVSRAGSVRKWHVASRSAMPGSVTLAVSGVDGARPLTRWWPWKKTRSLSPAGKP